MCTILITVSGRFTVELGGGGEYSKRIFLNTVHTAVDCSILIYATLQLPPAENNMHPMRGLFIPPVGADVGGVSNKF